MKRFSAALLFVSLLVFFFSALNPAHAQSPTPTPVFGRVPVCSQWVDRSGAVVPAPQNSQEISKKGYRCESVQTAIGSIDTKPDIFFQRLFSLMLGIGGGIALMLILYSGYRILSSQGDPEKIQGARETLTSAIVGLLFIIFSFAILEIVGVDILQIPGISR